MEQRKSCFAFSTQNVEKVKFVSGNGGGCVDHVGTNVTEFLLEAIDHKKMCNGVKCIKKNIDFKSLKDNL